MGTCISRCSSAATEDANPVQDKLVISQTPPLPSLPTTLFSKDLISKNPHCPSLSSSSSPAPTISTTITTTTTTTTTTAATSSCSSSSSSSSFSSSSSAISKDRSFSNDFLWPCIKDDPQIIQVDQVERSPTNKKPSKFPISTAKNPLSRAIIAAQQQSIPASCTPSKPPKKGKESSPSTVRQKSSRKEPKREKPISFPERNLGSSSIRRFNAGAGSDVLGSPQEAACKRQVACRGLSPSPSRRFNGAAGRELLRNPQEESRKCGRDCGRLSPAPSGRFERDACQDLLGNPREEACKRRTNCRGLSTSPSRKFNGDHMGKLGARFSGNGNFPVAVGKENLSPKKPSSSGSCLKKRGSCRARSHPRVDANVVGDIICNPDSNSSLSVEDINNPHISLDCFIFL